MKKNNDQIENYFGDVKTAYIDALYRDGKFYDPISKKKIRFLENRSQNSEGVHVKIIVPFHYVDLNDKTYSLHANIEDEKLFDAGKKLMFRLEYKKENKLFEFTIQIHQDLKMKRIGNKFWKLQSCECALIDGGERNRKSPIEVPQIESGSLNQIFVQTSIHFRPDNGSHTCNTFKTFRTLDGKLLEDLRQKYEVDDN